MQINLVKICATTSIAVLAAAFCIGVAGAIPRYPEDSNTFPPKPEFVAPDDKPETTTTPTAPDSTPAPQADIRSGGEPDGPSGNDGGSGTSGDSK